MVIGHVGHFDPLYSRNRVAAKALQRAGAEVVTIVDDARFVRRAPSLAKRMRASPLDAVLVGVGCQSDVAVARLAMASRGVPLVFDPMLSLYEAMVEDRATTPKLSARAARYRFQDWFGARMADLVMVDTAAHISYFERRLRVPAEKLRRIWVGADDEVMYPRDPDTGSAKRFRVLFYGTFIPLHGVEYIVEAAHVLEGEGRDIDFVIVGDGQTASSVRAQAHDLGVRSVDFRPPLPYTELPGLIASSDLCLGIFGTTQKASRVIPNKVFDALAMAKPVVTGDTPAAREALTHRLDSWLCPVGDAGSLAAAVATLQDDPGERRRLAAAGSALFRTRFSLDALAQDMAQLFQDAAGGRG